MPASPLPPRSLARNTAAPQSPHQVDTSREREARTYSAEDLPSLIADRVPIVFGRLSKRLIQLDYSDTTLFTDVERRMLVAPRLSQLLHIHGFIIRRRIDRGAPVGLIDQGYLGAARDTYFKNLVTEEPAAVKVPELLRRAEEAGKYFPEFGLDKGIHDQANITPSPVSDLIAQATIDYAKYARDAMVAIHNEHQRETA